MTRLGTLGEEQMQQEQGRSYVESKMPLQIHTEKACRQMHLNLSSKGRLGLEALVSELSMHTKYLKQ